MDLIMGKFGRHVGMDETPGVLLCPVFVAASKQKCDKYTGKTKPNKKKKQKKNKKKT